MTKRVLLKCGICGSNVSMSYYSLHNHAKVGHGMSLMEFYQMHKNAATNVRSVKLEQGTKQISTVAPVQNTNAVNVYTAHH